MKVVLHIIFITLLLSSCKEEKIEPHHIPAHVTKEQKIKSHQFWIKDESFKIDQFVKRNKWDAKKSETGIRYHIYSNGNGPPIKKGMIVSLHYNISLLSDTSIIYSSKGEKPHVFLVEMDNIESGLHEAVKYLRVGDKAKIILPHYAAHGLLGDMNKIPPLSAVVYDLEVVDAKMDY